MSTTWRAAEEDRMNRDNENDEPSYVTIQRLQKRAEHAEREAIDNLNKWADEARKRDAAEQRVRELEQSLETKK